MQNTKYSKLEMRGIGNLNERTLSRGNSNSIIKLNNSTIINKVKLSLYNQYYYHTEKK